jgi:hypothetical protein
MKPARRGLGVATVLALAAAACSSPASPTSTTGLRGTVTRGPTAPVCQVNVPCDAPFSAGFTATSAASPASVAHFRSNTVGEFTVYLAPGSYRIVPDADAPIISPSSQARTVSVGSSGLTDIDLHFDTGIR